MIETKINYRDIFKTDKITETIEKIKRPKSIRQIYNEVGHFGFKVLRVIDGPVFKKGEEFLINEIEIDPMDGEGYVSNIHPRKDFKEVTHYLGVEYKYYILLGK